MKRLLVATLAAAAIGAGFAAPAQADGCSGKIDVACGLGACSPDYPCTPMFCLVWYSSRCVV